MKKNNFIFKKLLIFLIILFSGIFFLIFTLNFTKNISTIEPQSSNITTYEDSIESAAVDPTKSLYGPDAMLITYKWEDSSDNWYNGIQINMRFQNGDRTYNYFYLQFNLSELVSSTSSIEDLFENFIYSWQDGVNCYLSIIVNQESIKYFNELPYGLDGFEPPYDSEARLIPGTKYCMLFNGGSSDHGMYPTYFTTTSNIFIEEDESITNFNVVENDDESDPYENMTQINFDMYPYFFGHTLNEAGFTELYIDDYSTSNDFIDKIDLLSDDGSGYNYIDPEEKFLLEPIIKYIFHPENINDIITEFPPPKFKVEGLEPNTSYEFGIYYETEGFIDDLNSDTNYFDGTDFSNTYPPASGEIRLKRFKTSESLAEYVDNSFEITSPWTAESTEASFTIGFDVSKGIAPSTSSMEVYYYDRVNSSENDVKKLNTTITDLGDSGDFINYYEVLVNDLPLTEKTAELQLVVYPDGKETYDRLIEVGNDSVAKNYRIIADEMTINTLLEPELVDDSFEYDPVDVNESDEFAQVEVSFQTKNDSDHKEINASEVEFRNKCTQEIIDNTGYRYDATEDRYNWKLIGLPINSSFSLEVKLSTNGTWNDCGDEITTAARENKLIPNSFDVETIDQSVVEFTFSIYSGNEYEDLEPDEFEVSLIPNNGEETIIIGRDYIGIEYDNSSSKANITVNIPSESGYLTSNTTYNVMVELNDTKVELGDFTTLGNSQIIIENEPEFSSVPEDPTTELMTIDVTSGEYNGIIYDEFEPNDLLLYDSNGERITITFQSSTKEKNKYTYLLSGLVADTTYQGMSFGIQGNTQFKTSISNSFTTAEHLPIEFIAGKTITDISATQTEATMILPITVGSNYANKYDNSDEAISKIKIKYGTKNGVSDEEIFNSSFVHDSNEAKFKISGLEKETEYSDISISIDNGNSYTSFPEVTIKTETGKNTVVTNDGEPSLITDQITGSSFQFKITVYSGGEYRDFVSNSDLTLYYTNEAEEEIEFEDIEVVNEEKNEDENKLTITYQVNGLIPETIYENIFYHIIGLEDEKISWRVETGNSNATSLVVIEDSIDYESVQIKIQTDKIDYDYNNICLHIDNKTFTISLGNIRYDSSEGEGIDKYYFYTISGLESGKEFTEISISTDSEFEVFNDYEVSFNTIPLNPIEIPENGCFNVDENSITRTSIDFELYFYEGSGYEEWDEPIVGKTANNIEIKLFEGDEETSEKHSVIYNGVRVDEGNNKEYKQFTIDDLVSSTEYKWDTVRVLSDDGNWSNFVAIEKDSFSTLKGLTPINYGDSELTDVSATTIDIRLELLTGNEYIPFNSELVKFQISSSSNPDEFENVEFELVEGGAKGQDFAVYEISGLEEITSYSSLEVKYQDENFVEVASNFTTDVYDSPIDSYTFTSNNVEKYDAELVFSLTSDEHYYLPVDDNLFVTSDIYYDVNKNREFDEDVDIKQNGDDKVELDSLTTHIDDDYTIKLFNLDSGYIYKNISVYPDGNEIHEFNWDSKDSYFVTYTRDSAIDENSFTLLEIAMNTFSFSVDIEDDGSLGDIDDVFVEDAWIDGEITTDEISYVDFGVYNDDEKLNTVIVNSIKSENENKNDVWTLTFEVNGLKSNRVYDNLRFKLSDDSQYTSSSWKVHTLLNKKLLMYILIALAVVLVIIIIIVIIVVSRKMSNASYNRGIRSSRKW